MQCSHSQMNTGGNTIALKSTQSLQNTEHLAMLMKAQSFTTQKVCIHCYILTAVVLSQRQKILSVYLQCHKNGSGHMSWQTSAVMYVS